MDAGEKRMAQRRRRRKRRRSRGRRKRRSKGEWLEWAEKEFEGDVYS